MVLNRGNHEDFAICSVYGFQLECYEKYDALTFSLFVEVFQVRQEYRTTTVFLSYSDRLTPSLCLSLALIANPVIRNNQ